jgi:hypothetical protein
VRLNIKKAIELLRPMRFSRRVYLGRVSDFVPSGKFYSCPSVDGLSMEDEQLDSEWWARTSEEVARLGEFILDSDGNDLFLVEHRSEHDFKKDDGRGA